jgi:uncharacterized ferritin-like protein (DUF455 family)
LLSLRRAALAALVVAEPQDKCAATILLAEQLGAPTLPVGEVESLEEPDAQSSPLPGRLAQPSLVLARTMPRYTMTTQKGRAALIHSLAHIELNAVNLALDALWRFARMPALYYQQWLSVAADEARHFTLLNTHLTGMGYAYGDFQAHDGLWDMAQRTKADVLARMALVPRTLEARGLDASPQVRNKLLSVQDLRGAEILSIILKDEVGHVAIGNYWYRYCCTQRQLDPVATYAQLALTYQAPKLRAPLNLEARAAAGFTQEELDLLTQAL